MNSHQVFRFEEYLLDLTRGCLRTEDRDIELRPKTFELLRYLVENNGRLVSKDEIFGTGVAAICSHRQFLHQQLRWGRRRPLRVQQ